VEAPARRLGGAIMPDITKPWRCVAKVAKVVLPLVGSKRDTPGAIPFRHNLTCQLSPESAPNALQDGGKLLVLHYPADILRGRHKIS